MAPQPDLVEMKEQVYKDLRPKEHFNPYHERTRTKRPDAMYELVRTLTTLYSLSFFRARCIDSDQVPPSGPVIIAPNHFSHMDHFFVADFLRRKVQFMAKSQMFTGPISQVYTHGGVFPVRRGYGDEEAFTTAHTVLERGGVICMYCEGGRSRDGSLAEQAKPGIGRLALESGATVVPAAIHGSSHVRNWRKGHFPKVTVQYGEPIRWDRLKAPSRNQQQVVADTIFTEIKALYAGLEQLGRAGVARRVRDQKREARRARRTATA